MTIRACALTLLFLAAACGGGEPRAEPTTTLPASTSATPLRTPQQMAEAIGCTDVAENVQLFTSAAATCTLNGDLIQFATFHDNAARDQWLQAAQGLGGRFATGDRFVVGARNTDLNPIAETLGAQLR